MSAAKKINSKQKGARFERELSKILREEYGYTDAHRAQQFCGSNGDADVVGVSDKLHIEAKHQEKMYLYDWINQAKNDAREGEIPAVFHKKNNAEILVTLTLPDFMKIWKVFDDKL